MNTFSTGSKFESKSRMIDVKNLVEKGLEAVGQGSVLLAAPFHVPEILIQEHLRSGRISGVVAQRKPSDIMPDLPVCGEWLDADHTRLKLKLWSGATLLFLGTRQQVGGRILFEAVTKGVRRIVHIGPGAEFESRGAVEWLRSQAGVILFRRLLQSRALAPLGERSLKVAGVSFEEGYRELLERASFLRLPTESFDSSYAILAAGSLGPGGAERQLAYSARGLARSGAWRVGVAVENLTPPVSNFHEATVRDGGGEVHVVKLSGGRYDNSQFDQLVAYFRDRYGSIGFHYIVEGILDYALFLREQRPALLHTWMDSCNVRAGVAALLVGVPQLILSGRSVAPDHFAIFQPYMRAGYRAIMESRDAIILNNSQAGANDYARWLGCEAGRIDVIHNGFEFPDDIRSRRSAARAELGFHDENRVLGGILRFSEEKRPDLWLEVADRFVRADPKNRAVAFGDGPMRPALLTEIEKRGLTGRVFMPGITRDAWTSFSAFDIFILTSRMEGLPNVLIEAQAAGLPVVAPNVGGAGETLVDGVTGLLAPDDEPDTLARLCIELGQDDARRARMGEGGAAFARTEFSADRMVERTLAVYGSPVET
jgi:glycosyltransferase involved in cell wall biosynthesis